VANDSHLNKTHLPEINKPQARISGVEIPMCYPIDSNTCIEVTTHINSSCLGLLPDSLKITWIWDLLMFRFVWKAVVHTVDGISLWLLIQLNTLPPGSRFHHS
jgi:hypothetical protein